MGKTFVKKNNGRSNRFNEANEDSSFIIEHDQKDTTRRSRREKNAKYDKSREDEEGFALFDTLAGITTVGCAGIILAVIVYSFMMAYQGYPWPTWH